MKSLFIVVTIALIFTACRSNSKTDKETVATGSAMSLSDSSVVTLLPDGTRRVTVVEKHNTDGSSTVTTTTDINSASSGKKESSATAATKVNTGTVATPAPVTTTEVKKKGWSNRAKGAAIGGVGGAATGVILSKNKVAGGILGGAIGAGGGYIIGNEIDRNKAKP
ncbi:MAG: hypothetical protein ABIN89_06745 [Chitinophagaceae bacterium]